MIYAELEMIVDSKNTCQGGMSQTRNSKSFAHVTGRTGNIRVGGRVNHANTGVSIKGFVSEKFHFISWAALEICWRFSSRVERKDRFQFHQARSQSSYV
jgi:hypothetical protein